MKKDRWGWDFHQGGRRVRKTGRISIHVSKTHKGSKQAERAALTMRSYLPDPEFCGFLQKLPANWVRANKIKHFLT